MAINKRSTAPLNFASDESPRVDKLPLDPEFLAFASKLRSNLTDAEQLMWAILRDRRFCGYKFRRQHPVKPYVLDFYCHRMKLAIELDGGQHNVDDSLLYDSNRTAFLEKQGDKSAPLLES